MFHAGGQIIVYRRTREGKLMLDALITSRSTTNLYYKCNFNETICPSLENERRIDKSSSHPPLGSPGISYGFRTKCKIVNQRGLDKLVIKITERQVKD